MPSETSFSKKSPSWWNFTLFKKNVTRFWPIWGLYGALWLLILPFTVLSEGGLTGYYEPVPYYVLNPYGIFLAMGFGVLAAMGVFSYLYNPRAVSLMHSLPVRREGLFLTNYLSGLSFFVAPQAVIALLTLAAQALNHCVDLGQVLLWFSMQTLFVLFFYSFAVFCAMFTGHLVALPVFYGILNLLALGVITLLNALFRQFIFGFAGFSGLERLVTWLTPAVRLFGMVDSEDLQTGGVGHTYVLNGVPVALLYALVGLGFAALALVVYRRRHLETAGDIVSVSWVRPVFKYGVAACAALALGAWLSDFFSEIVPQTMYTALAFLVLAGLIGYFTAEMLLKKSFKVFKKAWKGASVFCVVLICAALVLDLDLIGFNRVPDQGKIASVTLSGPYTHPRDSGSYAPLTDLSDPADVADVLALHAYIAQNRAFIERELNSDHERWETTELMDLRLYDSFDLNFAYTLENGTMLRRAYTLPMHQSDLDDPDSAASILTRLLNRDPARTYLRNIPGDATAIQTSLDLYNTEIQGWETVSVDSDADRAALLAAVKSDLDAGRIGLRFLFDDQERYETCYTTNLTFTLFKYYPEFENDPYKESRPQWPLEISLQTTATDTLACLRDLGILDDTHIILTHFENEVRLAALNEAEEQASAGAEDEMDITIAERAAIDTLVPDKDSFLVQGPYN